MTNPMSLCHHLFLALASLILFNVGLPSFSQELPLLLEEGFEENADRWEASDPKAWRLESIDGRKVYHQFQKKSDFEPPHRSPFNISLLKDLKVTDFEITASVKSTHPDYNHRDVCLLFGYQDPAHFYYVHLGKKTDDHANQIFIVNDAPRTKISTRTTPGTPWDDGWHTIKITRKTGPGTIEVFFDDMETPVMTAEDTTFKWGRFGLGTFDDTSAWDHLLIKGLKVE